MRRGKMNVPTVSNSCRAILLSLLAVTIVTTGHDLAAQRDSVDGSVLLVKHLGGTEMLLMTVRGFAREAGLGFKVSDLAIAGSPGEKAYERAFQSNNDQAQLPSGSYILHLFIVHNEGVYACLFDSGQVKAIKCEGAEGGMGATYLNSGELHSIYYHAGARYRIGWTSDSQLVRDGDFDERALQVVLTEMKKALIKAMKRTGK
jgi:hypothetical protein